MNNTFSHARAALKVFDAGKEAREAIWQSIATNRDVERAQQADAAALEQLQAGFFEDTKAFNSRDDCAHVDEAFIRHMVETSNPGKAGEPRTA